MSLNFLTKTASIWRGSLALPAVTSQNFLSPSVAALALLGGVRGKKSKGGGSTKNVCGTSPGKKRGLKVYDGQRVPSGTVLLSQAAMKALPGWNVRWGVPGWNLVANCNGRVMITTELMEPDFNNPESVKAVPADLKPDQKLFKHYVHVIPDLQHQIFKLVDRV